MDKKPFYITTPIYYVNGDPHMGHAYTTVAADVIARFKRLDNFDVYFVTGTDEHGLKVKQAADKQGITPQEFADRVSQEFRDVLPKMNISNDDFIRTTEDRHKAAAQRLWQELEKAGQIYLDKYAGWYAVRDEAYYTLDELTQGPDEDTMIAPTGAECKWVEEESYFFKLSEWQDKLLALYEQNPDFISPYSSKQEITSFVKGGLKDLSISRTTFDWGVPVPGNDKHVMYVWIDALTNYITALGYPDEDNDLFKKYWPADIHLVGKEITRFHCIYWPAFLMAADLPVPECIFANGWWTAEGQKMSKSLGNFLTVDDLIERYGVDQSRYLFLSLMPFGNDGDFSHERAVQKVNSDLANGLGNLAQRTLSMVVKNCDGKVPAFGAMTNDDNRLLDMAQGSVIDSVRSHMDAYKLHDALAEIWRLVDAANGYIDSQAPWGLKKTDPERMRTVLYVLCETIRCLGVMIQPVMPDSAAKILAQLSVPEDKRGFDHLSSSFSLKPETDLPQPSGVFPRIEPKEEAA